MQPVRRETAQITSKNAELVREATAATNRLDVDALVALLSPNVVWEENPGIPGLREVYRGRPEVRAWAQEILEVVDSPHSELEEITELSDDHVFTENVVTGHGKGSGVPVELRYWAILSIMQGRIARRQVFWNREDALEAAGLRE
jgi:ketosteroid isomerase-like protein